MKHTREAVVGTAALLAAGVVGIGTADSASAVQSQAKPARISTDQLSSNIKQAAAAAAKETGTMYCCPGGQASAGTHVHTPACSIALANREEHAD